MSNPGNMTYEESDHPRMGVTRRSSQKNELLIKPKLGSGKRPTRNIPDESFSYGIINEKGDNVKDSMIHREHVPNPHATKGKDIRSMNKMAPKMHVVRCEQQREYRCNHPQKLKVKNRIANVPPLPSVTNPDHVYGLPLPRGETTDDLIPYTYADDWIKMNQHHQHEYGSAKPQFVPPRTTNTVEVRSDACYQKYNPPQEKDRFVMSRFKTVPHKIDNVQRTPLLRDTTRTRRGGVYGAQAYVGDGDDYPSCGVSGTRTRLPCSGISPLLPRRNDGDIVCVAAQPAGGMLLPRFYKPCSSNPQNPCAPHPRRSDPDEAMTTVKREMCLRGPRRSDPD